MTRRRLDGRSGRWLDRYAKARPLLITAASCLLVHIVCAALTAWPNALVPNLGYAVGALLKGDTPSWWLPALRVMSDRYPAALLVTVIVAGLSLWRGGSRRWALALILTMSVLWWGVMVGLRIVGATPLGWQPA